MKKIFVFAVLLVMLFALSGCSSSKDSNNTTDLVFKEKVTAESLATDSDDQSSITMELADSFTFKNNDQNIELTNNDLAKPDGKLPPKIIKEALLELIVNDVQETTAQLEEMVKGTAGYIQEASIHQSKNNLRGEYTLRVPAEKMEEFIPQLEAIGQLERKRVFGNDVTEEYYDTEARKTTLVKQENRYLELLKKATNVKDMLEIESELVRIRSDIESLQARLKVLDNRTDMATITIKLRALQNTSPVVTLKEPFNDRIKAGWLQSVNGMVSFIEGLIIFLVMLVPYTPIIAIVGYAVYRIWKKNNSNSTNISED